MKLKNRISEILFKMKTGQDLEIIDEQIGDEVTVKVNDFYVNILVGKESGEPQSLSWSHDPTMFNTPIKQILVATPPTKGGTE